MSTHAAERSEAPSRRRGRRAVLVLAFAVVAAAVVVVSRPLWWPSPEERLVDALAHRDADAGASTCGPPLHETLQSLGELSSTSTFRWQGDHPLVEAVVVGRFTGIEPGRGFVVATLDGPDDVPVPFDDPEARYRSVIANLDVEAVVSGEVGRDAVPVLFHVRGAASDWDFLPTVETAAEGLPALGRVVVFLDRPIRTDEDPGVLEPLGRMFVAQVSHDGELDLPLLPPEDAERLTAATPDLVTLQRQVDDPDSAMVVDDCGHRVG